MYVQWLLPATRFFRPKTDRTVPFAWSSVSGDRYTDGASIGDLGPGPPCPVMGRHFCLLVLTLAWLPAAGRPLSAAVPVRSVEAIIQQHCVACHGPSIQQASLRLDTLPTDFAGDARAAETWHDVRDALNRGEMPPRDATPLGRTDRDTLLDWLDAAILEASEARSSSKSVVVMRRLNRGEYQNTMRDLLGLEIDFVKNLPPDEVSPDGFTNNGSVLRMSPLLMEHYLGAARDALGRAIVTGPPPLVYEHRAEETVVDKLKTVNWSNRLGRTGTFVARVPEFPDEGHFLLRVRARAEIPEGAPIPRMSISLGYRADTQTPARKVAEVDVIEDSSRIFEFRGRIEEFPLQSRTQSKYPGLLVWIRNAYSDGKPPPAGEKVSFEQDGKVKQKLVWAEDPEFPKIVVESVYFKAPNYATWPPEHHVNLLPAVPPDPGDEVQSARSALRKFLRRAYRRPVGERDSDPLLRFFGEIRPVVGSFEEAMRETMAMALISPNFLYRIEDSSETSGHVDDHELAARLSYFLWSTMPDARLMDLAARGRLADLQVLRNETLRMLDDPRSWAFVEQFSDQWLDLPGVHRVAINPNYYPRFDLSLKEDMRRETQHFFAELLRRDHSALHFLRSDFAMLNERMARHYGVQGPRGSAFERVALDGQGRLGGLVAHASILLSNSTGEDSHPVERGVWIRRALLGDPPAPPPPAVPNLNSADQDLALLPLKRQLELHRDNEACARCHQGIDPWGIALEEFDAVGLRRESVLRRFGERVEMHPVDTSSILPDGHEVDGAEALARYLVDWQARRFGRALAAKVLAYALGRTLDRRDKVAVDEIADRFERGGYRLRELCAIIVTSDSFRARSGG